MTVMGARCRQSRTGPVCYSTFARSATNTEMKTLRRLTSVAGHCSSTDLLHAWFALADPPRKLLYHHAIAQDADAFDFEIDSISVVQQASGFEAAAVSHRA